MTVVRARGLDACVAALLAAFAAALFMATQPMPYTYVPAMPAGQVPSGFALLAAPVVALGFLWRDVATPICIPTVRRTSERLIMIAISWTVTAAAALLMAVRLHHQTSLTTISGIAAGYLGLGFLLASLIGCRIGSTAVGALAIATIALAPLGGIVVAPYLQTAAGATLTVGCAILTAGTLSAATRGLDHGRTTSGRFTGVNDT